jgi:inhibitor of cysteine peptidase
MIVLGIAQMLIFIRMILEVAFLARKERSMKNRSVNVIIQDLTPSALMGMVVLALVLGNPMRASAGANEMIGPDVGMQIAMQSSEKTRQKAGNPMTGEEVSMKKSTSGQFDVVVGEEFSLTLASNATTGYHWELAEPLNEAIVKLVGSQYQAPNTNLLGAGGQEVWTFRAVGAGQTTINLKYVRPWEKDMPPAETASYTVSVR